MICYQYVLQNYTRYVSHDVDAWSSSSCLEVLVYKTLVWVWHASKAVFFDNDKWYEDEFLENKELSIQSLSSSLMKWHK
jgi:hypothetical protein